MPRLITGLPILTVVEFMILAAFIRRSPGKLFACVALVNILTHFLGDYVFENFIHNYEIIQVGIILIEAIPLIVFLEVPLVSAMTFSLLANLVTFMTRGLAL